MKVFLTILSECIIYLIIVLLLASLTSCNDNNAAIGVAPAISVYRAKVLENGTISKVFMSAADDAVYNIGDTVWVNLNTHRVDDTCQNSMQVVLCDRHIPH